MVLRETADQIFPELAQRQRTFLLAGAAGAVLSAIGYATNPVQFFTSYLMAYMLVLGLSLGALAFTMIHQLSGGAWGVITRQTLGAATRVLPVLTVLFLPIVAGMHHLYEWTHADVVAGDPILSGKARYLNVQFFLVRAAIYFAVWNGLAFILNRWSKEQDATGNPALPLRMQRLSAGGLVLYAITMTFASFDWMMSRDPHWFSTIYGALVMGGQGLITLAFQIVMLVFLSRRKPMNEALTRTYLNDIASLMFAFVVLWAYFSFSQYLIIWSGNLPEEIEWYLHRMHGGWQAMGVILVIFHFALPFFLLLIRRIKQNRPLIAKIAMAVIAARLLDLFWLIAPETHHEGIFVSWMDLVIPATLLALWVGVYLQQLRQRPLLPVHDPQFHEALGPVFTGEQPSTAHSAMAHTHDPHVDYEQPTGSTTEPDHINLRAVFGFGIGLAVVALACHLAMLLLFRVYANRIDASNPPRMFPIAPLADDREPPAPRLQTDPRADLAELRAGEEAVLNGYRWVDRNQSLVRIPISEAMRLTLQRGLPARAATGSAQGAAGGASPQSAAATPEGQERK